MKTGGASELIMKTASRDPLGPKGSPFKSVAAATLGFAIGIAGVAIFAPVALHLKEVLNLSMKEMSLLIAMPSLSASLLRIPFGAAVDENGGKTLMLFLLGMSMLGLVGVCALLAHTDEQLQQMTGLYTMLLFCGVLTGFGGAIFSVGAGHCAYWYPPDTQGRVLGAYAGIGNIPPGLVALALPFVVASFGMLNTYAMWLCVLALGTAVYCALGQNAWYFQLRKQGVSPQEAEQVARETYGQQMFPKGSAVQSLKMAACNTKTWALVVLYFLSYGGYLAMTIWMPTFWMKYHGFAPTVAGPLTAMYSEGYCLTRAFLGGPLADRNGGERVLLGAFPVVGIGAFLMVCTKGPFFHIGASIIMSVSMGICAACIFKLVPTYVPEALGGAAGWVGGLGAFGSFVLPPLLGWIVHSQGKAGFTNGFIVYVGLAVAGWTIVMLLKLSSNASSGYSDWSSEDEESSEASSEDLADLS